MPDSTTEDVEEKVEELENKVERLEDRTNGKNQIEISSHDLSVQASSEEASMEELMDLCSDEMDRISKRALVGEYQELEREGLHSQLFGD
ncbi:hypothetical protein Har1130_03775 [Haloarcula sp. CBA1130]|uniref:hypothetical protein n=1 Tax=unclassified Haloarcula TaxID=2624677 RepID=UPI00124720BD|nr:MULTISPECIES: hypothetical protein [unclassified Haloarcula]KAA9398503.1 hypothetical protein Har1129_09885 [Haloarcula sp. CBA1129]KAA9401906.1 hypothetical protein Har1130_03775 [Haloarcula sp. CBA1130]